MNAPKMLRLALAAAMAGLFLAHAPEAVAQDPPQDLDVPTGIMEITLPPDGVLRYANVIIRTGADVRFVRNLANTPVYILATGTITTEADSVIRVDGTSANGMTPGSGGPGGFGGGNAGAHPAGEGHGPGGGQGGCLYYACEPLDKAGHGAFGCDDDTSQASGLPYGNPVLLSLIGGSGGGGTDSGQAGSGGGGAILLSSAVRITHLGLITATGACYGYSGCGSGGAIRLLAPIVSGTGGLHAYGGYYNHGRIRVDALDRSGVAFGYNPPCAATVGSIMVEMVTNGTLRITEVGGQAISPDAAGQVFVSFDAADPKTVSVRVNGFGGIVPIEIALTPDLGVAVKQVVNADMDTANIDGNVTVTATFPNFPANQGTRVDAWTR